MINVQGNFNGNGITSTSSNQTEHRQGPSSADVKAFEQVMREQPVGEREAQNRWQENAGPLNERVRADGLSRTEHQASAESLFSMRDKAGMTTSEHPNATKPEANARSMHDLETGGLRTGDTSTDGLQGAMKGSDFLDALFRQASGANMHSMNVGQAAPSQGATMPDSDALEALVSRILVSTPEKGGSEVRLTLSDAAFRGTEVSIIRDTTGALMVKIVSSDPSAFQTLVSSRNELLSALEAEEKAPVIVTMEEEKGEANDNNSRQRSRGLDALDEDLR